MLVGRVSKWSDVETNKVLAAFEAGDTIAEIATEHQRSINAIQSKLVALVVKEDGFQRKEWMSTQTLWV
jgi:hypothetical protein